MRPLASITDGQCWVGLGLTLTVMKTDELRANVRLVGELDLASVRVLAAALEHELDTGRRFLRLDLSGLSFLDSAALDALADLHWLFLEHRGTLILVAASPRVRRLLALTGTDRILLIAADRPGSAILPVA